MGWKLREWILIGMLLCLFAAPTIAQVTTTQVADTIYHADGTPATGTVLISWPAFTTSLGDAIPTGSTSATIASNGELSVSLTPNAGAIPIGTYYTAVFHLDDGSISREYWVVPASSTPVKISAIESTVLPTTIAMQTVSKSYVDTAIAAAVAGTPLDSSPYVLKAGDTMTGPLSLPSDPTSATQAADKNYVDESVASLNGGLAQKVSTVPTAPQTVTQPTGTQLDVNNLNDVEYASQYVTGTGGNGVANAAASSDCASGCQIKAEQHYTTADTFSIATLNSQTHVTDARGGAQVDSFLNPVGVQSGGFATGQKIDEVMTETTPALAAQTNSSVPAAVSLMVTQEALTGGNNIFPADFEGPPYFKTAYSALSVTGTYNTQGQHGLMPEEIDCFGVGDCLLGARFINASGGWRDGSDEGAHLYDTIVQEDQRVFLGGCVSGCTTGSTTLMLREDGGGGTQGDGRFLIDKNPSLVITSASTGGAIISGTIGGPHPTAAFSGTSFPVSVFLETGILIPSQSGNMAPGTLTFPIATSGLPAGYAANTAAIGLSSGLACVVDQNPTSANYEMAPFTVVDATHLQMTLNKPHRIHSTVAIGGLCGYGLESTVDTTGSIRQLFPIVGTYSPTGIYYDGLMTPIVGAINETGGFANYSASIASLTRSGGIVTAVTSGFSRNLNGLSITITGAADSSYNGVFPITTTGTTTFIYAEAGPDSSTTGGTASIVTGGFAIYPMAEVLSVFNPATKIVDGYMSLAPNNVPWATNDPAEQPHFFQEYITPSIEAYTQIVPRPTGVTRGGVLYSGNNSGQLTGWSIENGAPATNYFGYGGTHTPPQAAYESTGVWRHNMDFTAGDEAVFSIQCNLHGCNNWNSTYDLFELQSAAGGDYIQYSPQTSQLTIAMRTGYSFTPTGFNADTINVGTLNAGAITGGFTRLSVNGLSTFTNSSGLAVSIGSGPTIALADDSYLTATASPGQNAGMVFSRGDVSSFASADMVTGANLGTGWSMQMQPNDTAWHLFDRAISADAIVCTEGTGAPCTFNRPVAATSFHEALFTPSSSAAACNAGDFADDANFHYVCVAANTWRRVALSTF